MKPNSSPLNLASNEASQALYRAFGSLKNPEEAQKFLEDLCTPAELQAISDRWRVVALIKAGKPYRQIYEETGVSMTTIGRVARCIRFGTGGYNLMFERTEGHNNA